jgi:pantoate--beta-alanine ligase
VKVARTPAEVREALAPARRDDSRIGLVPTMGYLHEGHLSLLAAARAECDVVVMSLFVNPTQFRPGEDFDSYPRDEERDLRLAEEAGADLVYAPAPGEVYPDGFSTEIRVSGLTEVLDGAPDSRGPEHFHGVTTVVAKLFNTVGPDIAYFGQKDAQQAVVIRRMAADLDFAVQIRTLPIVREPDGLAKSSRNVRLSPADRERAVALSRALQVVSERAEPDGLEEALARGRRELEAAGVRPEYLEARDAETLAPVAERNGRPVLIAVAARLGDTRLIDNVLIEP